jgi:myosin-3
MCSYKIIGYKFTSNPPVTEATCRKICEMSKVQGFQVGKTKVFLRYFHVDELNLKLKPYPDAAKHIQKRMFP